MINMLIATVIVTSPNRSGPTLHRYDEVLTFLLDAEELLGIYGLHVPDLSLPAAHDFDVDVKTDT